jgi:hypothetical protein
MMNTASNNWERANQRYLSAALMHVREALQAHIARAQGEAAPASVNALPSLQALAREMEMPPALEMLCAMFRLSAFERAVLLLCAGVELDSSLAALCAQAQGDPQRPYATFSLALAALPDAHWSALTPAGPLRRWRLIDIGLVGALTTSPLRIDERVLHYLAGAPHLDERLSGLITPLRVTDEPAPSHRALAEQVAVIWSQARHEAPPLVQLSGVDTHGKHAIVAAACARLELNVCELDAAALPNNRAELEPLARLWEREAILSGSALLITCDDLETADAARLHGITRFAERLHGAIAVATRERLTFRRRAVITLEARKPTVTEQRAIWYESLGEAAPRLNGQVDQLVAQFDLNMTQIRTISTQAMQTHALDLPVTGARSPTSALSTVEEADLHYSLWDACRTQARPRLDDLAQRIEAYASWDDLVLPEAQLQVLRDIAAHVRRRATVYEAWGFAGKGARGLGISALFAGASGAGKTMAAEVLGRELRLDVYRIDLSSVVSKYIGETEKNLRRVFDAAEEGGAILLFDEADALFGKRSEVKDSHDRYANIEVSYLLQRMEAYRGLAILTTNLKNSLDTAFLRRIRFVVQFPFPDAKQRAAIWQRVFPQATPTEGLHADKLARLNVAGGNIRNIALNAAFLAADADEPVGMIHLLRAARSEYAKLEKPLTEAEIAGWVDA